MSRFPSDLEGTRGQTTPPSLITSVNQHQHIVYVFVSVPHFLTSIGFSPFPTRIIHFTMASEGPPAYHQEYRHIDF